MSQSIPPEASDDAEGDPVYEQAALWVARLSSPDATAADRKAFEAWRAADPAHAEAYAEMDQWRRTMGRVPDPRRRRRGKPAGLAVAAALGLAGALGHHIGLFDRLRADAWTDVGGFRAETLADGSRVDLNTDTALALHYTAAERGIELLRGEAAFEVVPDSRRPFVVRGKGLSVRAVGTRFFVRVDGVATPVGVAEGQVEVTTPGGRAGLRAGETLVREQASRVTTERSDVARMMAWREGRLVFSGQPLSVVLAELERYRRGRIVSLDPTVGTRRFSGTLDPRDTDEALAVLATTMDVRITRVTPLLVLVRPGS
ncbi:MULTISPECIES: FecR domain-containing protein [Methylobacterium]|uniref:Protein FecR n=2 Tax=Pseudomonadota TaxID=1224 RepID=A0ABQ4SPZ8_9HYPH|nr:MULTISPECIES: FecR domain-containing protein [Methylobacterium]PIU04276.1 MAG: iron dicitrate transport regulator FecR [Methylobacterium sp. CG09_land_8_20_14_0_10_71_15]PIU13055.1 MAG: iron dicitrate transport regulator FecR [Methylobacterium sp. CG08_land_8_20_14_0_20_71_15]GBU15793.1 iron dicitrate transporter FecR [Methylobacterium sp.]GJE05250.1 Protein FecR [Methylobacterium jeotgali]